MGEKNEEITHQICEKGAQNFYFSPKRIEKRVQLTRCNSHKVDYIVTPNSNHQFPNPN